ncbi:TlpA family protein disulfide reductase [Flavobacterium sp.]|jgi:thiol-disulfide isomerase/thioredoxin|uniref:TlpA family protein disulfide reductase n=1 Tax=Flavobacterium sp. TaxID=239 RepID=UPI0037BF2B60
MIKHIKLGIVFILIGNISMAQLRFSMKAIVPQAAIKEVRLKAFSFADGAVLASATADEKGVFSLDYSNYTGAALLEIRDSKSVIVLLNQENFEIQWDNLEDFKSLKFINSTENNAFLKGINIAQQSDGALLGLKYLKPIYESESEFQNSYKIKVDWINNEIGLKEKAFPNFLATLPKQSYVVYYLTIRKLLQDIPLTSERFRERLPENEKQFNALDFNDTRLLQSGLYKELFESYFVMLETYGDLNIVSKHVTTSVEKILLSLDKNPILKQDVAEYLFRLFEKRSLFANAEHLALTMLNTQNCVMDAKHEALFEQYRKMAKGKMAPEIIFENATKPLEKLSAISSKYKLVVFGASWCSKCQEDLPKLIPYYQDWKTKYNMDIVFVSLDTEKDKFNAFVKDFPWLSSCELKGWESKAALDYCVFGSPTMYLLGAKNTIVLKPVSEKQIQAWIEIQDPTVTQKTNQ